jgi:hypothetical protein
MSNTYNYIGWSAASSRYTGHTYNGIHVAAVIRKSSARGANLRAAAYIALCYKNNASDLRVIDYNHVVQAANGLANLAHKYNDARTPEQYGLNHPSTVGKPGVGLVNAIANEGAAAKAAEAKQEVTRIDLNNLDVATTLQVLNKLVDAAKKNGDVRQLIKLVANTL